MWHRRVDAPEYSLTSRTKKGGQSDGSKHCKPRLTSGGVSSGIANMKNGMALFQQYPKFPTWFIIYPFVENYPLRCSQQVTLRGAQFFHEFTNVCYAKYKVGAGYLDAYQLLLEGSKRTSIVISENHQYLSTS